MAVPAAARAQGHSATFDIPSEPIAQAIADFGRQAGLQVIAPTGQLHGVVVPALSGRRDVRTALAQLIAHTPLSVASYSGSVIVLRMNPGKAAAITPAALVIAGQETPAPSTAAPPPTAGDGADASSSTRASDIVVTGSRIISNGNSSPTPVTVVQSEDLLRRQPTTLVQALTSLPEFAGSKGVTSGSQAGPPNGGNGAATLINLRNLTPDRTLILLDGQRFPPTLFTGAVDVDAVPEMLIQRVDVVTGGVSAVYGSDAVAGVVNFVTNKTFDGVRVQAQRGISTYGDDPSYKVGIAVGRSFMENRLHLEGSYMRYDDSGLNSRTERPNLNNFAFGGGGTAANPYVLYSNVRSSNRTFGGLIGGTRSALAGSTFNTNGVATTFQHGTSTGSSNTEVGGDGSYNDSGIKSPLRADQLFGRADFDATDTTHLFFQVAYNKKYNQQSYGYPTLGVTLRSTNPYLPAQYQTALAAGGTTFTLAKLFNQAPTLLNNADEQQVFLNGGIDGKLGGWDWGVTANYAKTKLTDTLVNNVNNQNLAAALDAVVNPATGQVVCAASLTNAAYANCAPLNLFGPTSASQAAINYILGTTHLWVNTKFFDGLAHLGGTVVDLPAGPLKVALTGEFRANTLGYTTDYPYNSYVNCTGITLNCSSTTSLYRQVYGNLAPVTQHVEEGAAEVNVPIFKDQPFARGLDFNGAARFTHYSNSGSYWTWKAGLTWTPVKELTVRGTLSRDIHAPTLYQQFQAISIVPATLTDYLTGSTGNLINTVNKGNTDLKAEVGKTRTVGLVWQPERLRGVSFAFDYFNIKVSGAIQQVRGWDQPIQNACYASGGSSPYCALQDRPNGFSSTAAANTATAFYAEYINIASVSTYGFDGEVNYRGRILGRPTVLRLLATYQPHIRLRQPGVAPYDCGSAANCAANYSGTAPLRINASAHMDVTDALGFDLQERFRSSEKQSGEDSNPAPVYVPRLRALGYTDLTVTFRLPDPTFHPEFFVNVLNLFNAKPAPTAGSGDVGAGAPGGGYAVSFDDPIGRYVTVGVRAKF